MLRFAIASVVLAGCVTPASTFVCESSADCSGGTCEADGLCSFTDAACDSGRRYGDASGDKSGQCVGGGGGTDVCGDGMVTGDEECEDGNDIDTDFCVNCKFAKCGDGHVLAGVEDCDDSNVADGDTCNANCLDCGPGSVTNPMNNHCYTLVENAVDWDTAANDCATRGGYLASIGDASENTFVTGLLVNAQYWIGLDESQFSGTFRWQDDDTLGFTSWAAAEPSNGASDFCAGMLIAGTWDHQDCNTTHPYVCEREPPHVGPTNHIYRRFSGRAELQYAQAITACAALVPPAHLVTITDQAELDFVNSITNASRTWIGLDDIATEGTFVWITGETSSFFAWGTNEPDVGNAANEDGVALRSDGFWETRNLTGGFGLDDPYICEIDPAP